MIKHILKEISGNLNRKGLDTFLKNRSGSRLISTMIIVKICQLFDSRKAIYWRLNVMSLALRCTSLIRDATRGFSGRQQRLFI